jgi:hypothetical protein
MDNQHRQIKGYRELNQEEIDFMNRIKAFGPELQALTDEIREYLRARNETAKAFDPAEAQRIYQAEPHAWLDVGTKDLQVGLMKLTRSIAQPGFF